MKEGTVRRSALIVVALAAAVAVLVALAGCGKQPADQGTSETGDQSLSGKIMIGGSTTVLPIAQAAAEQFMAENPQVRVEVQGTGSSEGIKGVSEGVLNIGDSSRELKPEEGKLGLVDHKIAIDALALVVNPDNKVTNLTRKQVVDILTGKITNWKDVGGADDDIVVVGRDEASGTREFVQKDIIGEDARFAADALALPGAGQVKATVAKTPAGIGYVGLGAVDDSVKALKVEGVAPGEATVKDDTYAYHRYLHMFTKGEPADPTKAFLDFVLGEKFQTETVASEFVPVK